MSLISLMFGRPLANQEGEQRKIGALEGVPAMGLDGLGSSAYGPEAALAILIPLGTAGLRHLGPIMVAIVVLLAVLYLSYRQTLGAYPSHGGAYVVAKENLGRGSSLLAAAALMVDYVLNVCVGVSAGVAALVSAVPALHPWTLSLCLGVLSVVTLVNLRGTRESGRLFALPTYTFVGCFLAILVAGLLKVVASGGHPVPVVAPPPLKPALEAASLWLLVRAFAAGCTAMTGVEAVSNGMSAFKDPAVTYGRRTLTAICLILGLLLAGVASLAHAYGIGAMDQTQPGYQSVLSQLAGAIVGNGLLYGISMTSLLLVLVLSANTSFVGFPRLCRVVATDGFLPRPFAMMGRRLVFSVGILYLAATSALLLWVFGGITDRLIPLFAVGAFLTFTMSQAGMVVHWRRELSGPKPDRRHRLHMMINAVGAATTLAALVVITVAKFKEGAWITILVIPLVILLLRSIRRYYDLLTARIVGAGPFRPGSLEPPIVLVVTQDWNRLTAKALRFAMTLSADVRAIHLVALEGPDTDEWQQRLRATWMRDVEGPSRAAGVRAPPLILRTSPYRRMHATVLAYIEEIHVEHPARAVAVMIPEIVKQSWWQWLMHTHRGRRLRSALLRYGGPDLTVIGVPWRLDAVDRRDVWEDEDLPEGGRGAGRGAQAPTRETATA